MKGVIIRDEVTKTPYIHLYSSFISVSFRYFGKSIDTSAYIIHPDMYGKACWDPFVNAPAPQTHTKRMIGGRCYSCFPLQKI